MITDGVITLDPHRLVPVGDHRYRIERRGCWGTQLWTCERCGDTRRPSDPQIDCPAGPVTP